MKFADIGLSDELLSAVTAKGYDTPTAIQAQAIPSVLMMKDIIGVAQTGTGKTASFVLPMIDILAHGRRRAMMPRSLILEPTRELAAQVAENFEIYGKNHKLNMALLIGGVSFPDQERALERGADVLIATPGRLLDHFERGGILLNDVKILVIDEADRMLDMGFIPDVERIVATLQTIRQTLFFSATMPPEIKRLADRFLSNPKEVTVSPPASASNTIVQGLIALVLVRGGGNLPLDLGNYASLNNLVFGIPNGENGYALASFANLFYLWSIFLVAVAARVWSGLGWGKALLLAALPSLLIYLPWLAIVLTQG